MPDLRQKTWAVMIRPYSHYSGDMLVHRGPVLRTGACQNPNNDCTEYDALKGGEGGEAECWMKYESPTPEYANPITSFAIAREVVKEVMDDLGYSIHDIMLTEVIPKDHYVTPLA